MLALTAAFTPALSGSSRSQQNLNLEHRYRIKGAVRPLLFWISADDIGGARIVRSSVNGDQVYSLLIGSDPRRAPKKVNDWGYLRESTSGPATTVFGLRTLTDGDSPQDAEMRRSRPDTQVEFGLVCSTVSGDQVQSTTGKAPFSRDATFREFDLLMSSLGAVTWTPHDSERPPGVAAGFLGAMDVMMRESAASARENPSRLYVPSSAYVYKDTIYDFVSRHTERVPRMRTRTRELHNLIRADLVITNRSTRAKTDFSVTFGTEGDLEGVPVHARYQPKWWFRIELELDDEADVPADPARDPAVLAGIDQLCRSAVQ